MYTMTEGARWNPWAELRDQAHVGLAMRDLPDGIRGACIHHPRGPVILLDRALTQTGRNHVLTHELVHLERGGGCPTHPDMPDDWAHSVSREERRVEDEAVRRQVPPAELRRWVVAREQACEHVEAWQVAEEWHVPEHVADRALRLLLDDLRAQIREGP